MQLRQLPIFPTIVVVIAAGIMVALGIWQLGRAEEKAALIAKYETAQAQPLWLDFDPFRLSRVKDKDQPPGFDRSRLQEAYFRTVQVDCSRPTNWRAVAGRNANGQSGYAHLAECNDFSIQFMDGSVLSMKEYVAIGWSRGPDQPKWGGGEVTGTFAPFGEDLKVVSDESLAGLEPLAKPDPRDLPNNHLAYAGQWFFFALTALVIYWFAVQSRLKARRED